jgi:hypothetical protein
MMEVKGTITEKARQALELEKQALALSNTAVKQAVALSKEKMKQVDAMYKSKEAAAKAALEQNKVWKASEGAANAAGKFASNMQKGAAAASKAASAVASAGSGGGSAGDGSVSGSSYATQIPKIYAEAMRGNTTFNSLYKMQQFYKEQDKVIDEANLSIKQQKGYHDLTTKAAEYAAAGAQEAAFIFNESARMLKSQMSRITEAGLNLRSNASASQYQSTRSLPTYANGGYVNGAQRALIGEAGPEYVIPANRMDSALANYAAGKRGNAVLSQQVNVTTGPVQHMDGTNYVTLEQATSMSQSAARQGAQMALTQIKTDPGTRRSIGVA